MPWPFRRSGEARRVKSEMRGYGADLLEVRELFEADTVAKADQLGWDRNAPGLVVVLAASGSATVALGGYGVAIRAQFKDKPELTTPGPPDPIWLFAQALDDPQAVMDAFRVLVWGYAREVVASLWPDRWAAALEQLAGVMNVASDVEAKVFEISPVKPEFSGQDLARQQAEYRTLVLAAMAEAASGREIQSDNPWLKVALPAWTGFYAEGQETIAQLMHDMNAPSAETPDKDAPSQGAHDTESKSPLLAASERLYEHIDDIPFSSEFKSILVACLETANVVLTRFQADRHEGDAEVGPETEALLEAWQSPAAADRAVRTTTWLILGGVMAQHSSDRQQEAIDAASAAMPLSPLALAQVRDHFDECSAWVRNSHVEKEVARLVAGEEVEPDRLFDEWGVAVTLNSFDWLMLSVLQRPRPEEDAKLDDDSASWGLELMEGTFSVFNDMLVSPDGDETRDETPAEAEANVDVDQLLEYWRKHRHEYLDPEE